MAPSIDELLSDFDSQRSPEPWVPDRLTPAPVRRRLPRWAIALAAAGVVLLIVGGVAVLSQLGDEDAPVITEPIPETTPPVENTLPPPDTTAPETSETILPATPGPTLPVPPPSDVPADQWAAVPLDQTLFPAGTDIQLITWGGPGLVMIGRICGNDGCPSGVWTSDDGFAWVRTNPDFGPEAEVRDVIAGGPGLVAVGRVTGDDGFSDAAVWTSSDGRSWDRVPHDDDVFGRGTSVAAAAIMQNIEAGPNGLVVVGVTCLDPPCAPIETV